MEPTQPQPPKTTILPSRNTDLPADAPWWARWLVANVEEAWKWLSFNVPFIAAAAVEVDQATGGQLMEFVPPSWRPHLAAAGLFVAAFLRLVNQKKGNGK